MTNTSSPIDSDIVQDISTEPVRQSLAVIINEFGTGLAARGSDLNAVIHRANPALGNTEKVLKILAGQNRTLAALATDSDTVLAPLARERRQITGFITQANTTAVASAARAHAISETFRKFPAYLAQLRPLMVDLGTLADQGTPLMQSLGQSATRAGAAVRQPDPVRRPGAHRADQSRRRLPAVPAVAAGHPAAGGSPEPVGHGRPAHLGESAEADEQPR